MYEQWLEAERQWIGEYCSKIKRKTILRIVPAVLIILTVLFGLIDIANGNTEIKILLENAMGGFMIGVIVCTIYLAIVLPRLSPKQYIKKIEKAVKQIKLSESEKEQLAQEFLSAEKDPKRTISFWINGHGSKDTPARFVCSEHYVMLEGSYPYAIIIKLSDIEEIHTSEEEKSRSIRRGGVITTEYFTLYTIGFYRKDRAERGLSEEEFPDEAMGFFSSEIRDKAAALLGVEESGVYIGGVKRR